MFEFIPYSQENYKTATSYITYVEAGQIKENTLLFSCPNFENMTQAEVEKYLMNATYILDNLIVYNGYKQLEDQALVFPRNFEAEYTISLDIKLATAYIASLLKQNKISSILSVNNTQEIQSEKVDVLEVSYFESKKSDTTKLLNSDPILRTLLSKYRADGTIFARLV